MKLDLGCGKVKKEGYYSVDHDPESHANLVKTIIDNIPFEDSTIEAVYSSHFLEHLEKPELIIAEIWRVCQPKAEVFLKFPLNLEIPDPYNLGHKIVLRDDFLYKYIDPKKFLLQDYTRRSMGDNQIGNYWQAEIILIVKK